MKIGIGLPNPVPGTPGRTLVEWSRRAEELGFTSLATIDRVAYPSYESLIALAAAAAVTEKVSLFTNVLLGPTRDAVMLAKQAASVDQISDGRLLLGLGVGFREDDFSLVGQGYADRGKRFDEMLTTMKRVWRGEILEGTSKEVAPRPVNGAVPIVIGGTVDAAFRRTVEHAVGWTAGGAPPEQVAPLVEKARAAWSAAGKEGQPGIWALTYFAFGDDAEERAAAYLTDYYGEWGGAMAAGIPKNADQLRERIDAFAAVGVDELLLDPTIGELDQLERAAEAALGR